MNIHQTLTHLLAARPSIPETLALYTAVAGAILWIGFPPRTRTAVMLPVNLAFTALCFFRPLKTMWPRFALCAAFVVYFYICLRLWAANRENRPLYYAALLMPIAALVLMKAGVLTSIVAFSFLTFRLALVPFEMDAGRIDTPSLVQYLEFAFFPLPFLVGPINPYSRHAISIDKPDRAATPLRRSLGRILAGLIKVFLVAQFFKTLDAESFLLNGFYHGPLDLLVSAACSYLFLYFNFSGVCDAVIGAAGLFNVSVKENFDNPLAARNLRDFWNRFHITLSHLLRDILFTPGVVALTRGLGERRAPAAVLIMTFVTFMTIGLWHGTGMNFVVFGLLHSVGLMTNYLFTLGWQRLPENVRRFSGTQTMRVASTTLTFCYVSFATLFVLNDWKRLGEIFSAVMLW